MLGGALAVLAVLVGADGLSGRCWWGGRAGLAVRWWGRRAVWRAVLEVLAVLGMACGGHLRALNER
ncbi:hypothetical protein ACFVYD_05810 [Streptomyces sp. NPDC058301]|uniref:hypothetical protein n=1 Tax=Streptomyces sp. NPDC058301 TaxID=3346436 RepID=UPI0036EC87B2